MPAAIPLVAQPVLYAVEAKLHEGDTSKFDLHIRWKVMTAEGPAFIDGTLPDQAWNTWDGSWWGPNLNTLMTETVEDWGYSLPT